MKTSRKLKIGRPSKGDKAKIIAVMVKVSKRELRQFRAAAKKAGQPLGPWLIQHRREEFGK
ncbi:MAG: hypothetical protein ABSE73_22215 [Planctomycetota bacterium]